MRLTPSDIVSLYRPTLCSNRVFLRERGESESKPTAFDELLQRLGERHEQQHLQLLGAYEDLSVFQTEERLGKTIDAINKRAGVLYQPAFRAATQLAGVEVEIVGLPDYLIQDGDGYAIRDSKLSRRIDEKNHREIQLQLQLYGWLYQQTVGVAPKRLEVHNGKNEVIAIQHDGGLEALSTLEYVLRLKQMNEAAYEPVGWSKCLSCRYKDRCWEIAEANHDVATVYGVDQSLARTLHEGGVQSRAELLARFDLAALAELKRPQGKTMKKVGVAAEGILAFARAMELNQEFILKAPNIPVAANYVIFDLEGIPPQYEESDKIYLWGMQVCGENPTGFLPAVAGFGPDGDRDGWFEFLMKAKQIFLDYGDIKFVHWSDYEKTKMKQYMERYGDSEGVGVRVQANLLDLHDIAEESIVLPLPSYSLKVIEKYVGFKRTQEEFGGQWSMAQYIEAVETTDEAKRNALMGEILKYNKEDLEATWAVFQWLRAKRP
jgi:predicted RecB family nuclease